MKFKSTLLLIVTFFIVLGTQAQTYYSREYNYYYSIDQHDHLSYISLNNERKLIYEKRATNNVESSKKVKVNHKNDTLHISKIFYNKKGRITRIEKVDRKGRIFKLVANYSNDTLLTHYEITHDKIQDDVRFEYNKEGKLTHLMHLRNGEKHYEIKKYYMGEYLLETASTDYSKRKPKTYKILRSINKEGKVLRIDYFTNDKLERVWEYDCSDKGVEVKPKKTDDGVPSSSSCSWRSESNDGSYTLYYRTLNGKHINLYERHFRNDSVLISTNTYDEKDRLKYETIYYENHKINLFYKSNGKIKWYKTEVLDPELGAVASTTVYNGLGKSHNSIRKTYNEKGLIVELVGYYNSKKRMTNISYSHFDE